MIKLKKYFNDNKHKFKEVVLGTRRETHLLDTNDDQKNLGVYIARFKSRDSADFFNSKFCEEVG